MSLLQAYLWGVMTALTPSVVMLAFFLLEIGDTAESE